LNFIETLFLKADEIVKNANSLIQKSRYLEALEKIKDAALIMDRIQSLLNAMKSNQEDFKQLSNKKIKKQKFQLQLGIEAVNKDCKLNHILLNNQIVQMDEADRFPGIEVILKNIPSCASKFNVGYFLQNQEIYEKWVESMLQFRLQNKRIPTKEELWELY